MGNRRYNNEYVRYSSAGIELVLFVLLFFGIGHWIDRRFGMTPVFSLTGGIVGIVVGFYSVFRTLTSDDKGSGNGNKKTPK